MASVRHMSWLLAAALVIGCAGPLDPVPDPSHEPSQEPASQDPVSEDPSEEPSESPNTLVLAAPTELSLEEEGDGIVLTWKDNSVKEEGYLVEKEGPSSEKKYIPANSETWTDPSVEPGVWTYTVKAYKGLERGEGASVEYVKSTPARMSVSVQTSSYMAAVRVIIDDDGASGCKSGVCWSTQENPTVDSESWEYPKGLTTGKSYYALLRGLEQGVKYYVRAWARSAGNLYYSAQKQLILDEEPSALNAQWTEVKDYSLPSSVKLYKSSTSVTGSKVNMWRAEADFSAGDIELRTLKGGTSLKTLSAFVTSELKDEKVYVVTNGGYFFTPYGSYSYIVDRGNVLAKNVASLNREESYFVARGAFGLDENMTPSIWWVYNSTDTWAYDEPLPIYDGGPVLRPTADFPCDALVWEPYEAMGGGPVLVRDGRICFDFLKSSGGKYLSNTELFQSDIFASGLRAPRTAVGYKPDGKVVLLVADGRNSGGSAGLTLDELARIMKGLGCSDVLNLDGGGSTMMTVGSAPVLLNSPSDGKERAVYSYMAIVGK